ncbi:LTA synthase family protein [Alkaliphilus serpentinus]|uniref:LTA synthase family protein n=1 Tax=Alkaliphilus serpentinus TaxID=1482731 RepID=A0A833HR38_9FIRM|nr:LTA synthase family protein [Alkaliphilus serpentinus]KAB3532713.1 LTA synthase family protein [Alkaliphilus serpentinus]
MISNYTDKKNIMSKDLFLFLTLSLIKLLIFHGFIGIERNYLPITLFNGLSIFSIYLIVYLFNNKVRLRGFMIVHFVLSLLFFINSLYYSHFYTLMPVHVVYQIGHLTGVSSSVKSLMKLYYLLYFIDFAFLFFRYKRKTIYYPPRRVKPILIFGLILLLTITTVTGHATLRGRDDVLRTPYNLGMINYHVFDLIYQFLPPTVEAEEVNNLQEIITEEGSREDKELTGLIEGKNVIVIQAESFQSFMIGRQIEGQWITPVLNQLISDNSIFFPKYYEQVGWGNTSDAEFVSHSGLHSSTRAFSYKKYEGKDLMTLPKLLKEEGYDTLAFHGNTAEFWNRRDMYPFVGFDEFISIESLQQDEIIGMGLSDRSLFKQAIPILKDRENPFYAFMITLTSHYPFHMEDSHKGLKIEGEYAGTVLADYFQTVHYLDKAIGELIEDLKEAGLYEDTVIVFYGDHHGLKTQKEEEAAQISSFIGKEYREDEMLRVPLMIHMPGSDVSKTVEIAGGQIDFFPTMANLLGLDIDNLQIVGKDLLNTQEGFVVTQIHIQRGTYIDNERIFLISKDGDFEFSQAWDLDTGEPVDLEESREDYHRALAEINLSEYILDNNLLIQEENKAKVDFLMDRLEY